MARPKVPLLSADRIADAALELVDSGELFGVNALARRLGVTPSSLYNHVRGRDEIVELMRGRLAERSPARTADRHGRGRVGDPPRAAAAVRRAPQRHPAHRRQDHHRPARDRELRQSRDGTAPGGLSRRRGARGRRDPRLVRARFGLDLASPDEIWQPQGRLALGRLLANAQRGAARSDRAFEEGLEPLLDQLRLRLARLRDDD